MVVVAAKLEVEVVRCLSWRGNDAQTVNSHDRDSQQVNKASPYFTSYISIELVYESALHLQEMRVKRGIM